MAVCMPQLVSKAQNVLQPVVTWAEEYLDPHGAEEPSHPRTPTPHKRIKQNNVETIRPQQRQFTHGWTPLGVKFEA